MFVGEVFFFCVFVDDLVGNSFIVFDFCDGVGKWEKGEYFCIFEQNEVFGFVDINIEGFDDNGDIIFD